MMIYRNENYANAKQAIPDWQDGDECIGCNFSQPLAHSVTLGDDKAVTFTECNVHNCDEGARSTFNKCYQRGKYWEYCANHPDNEGIARLLPVEPVECPHVEEVTIYEDDGVELYREYTYTQRVEVD